MPSESPSGSPLDDSLRDITDVAPCRKRRFRHLGVPEAAVKKPNPPISHRKRYVIAVLCHQNEEEKETCWQRMSALTECEQSLLLVPDSPTLYGLCAVFYRLSGISGSTYSNHQICSFNQDVTSSPLPPISTKLCWELWFLDLCFIAVPPSFTEKQSTSQCFQPKLLFVLQFFPPSGCAFILCPSVATVNGKIKHHKSLHTRDVF